MKNIDAIIFDLNGVFLFSQQPLSQLVANKFNVDKDLFWNKFKETLKIARTSKEMPENLWDPITDLLKINKDEFFNLWFSMDIIDSKMLQFAKDLKNKNYKIFILSNSLKERVQYYRQKFPELFSQFDGVYFSSETGFVKPDPLAFENILKLNNLDPKKCIYFDDSQDNVDAAAALGIQAKLFENLENSKEFIGENNL
ncbi:MAG: HAD family phosphatase [Candidatus Shapirobacteria bacterium]